MKKILRQAKMQTSPNLGGVGRAVKRGKFVAVKIPNKQCYTIRNQKKKNKIAQSQKKKVTKKEQSKNE